ncbi:RHS repeat-associated core domain-containing protein [Peterkaempfera bronchialis]|uniref:RHS repeat-associated core domain-containing protein n=1 Tax=Peterkaempfera bronchialis TaxID=2126346 RepID=UPI003C2B8B28
MRFRGFTTETNTGTWTQTTAKLNHYDTDNDTPRADQDTTRYAWLGGKHRSSETVTGLTLMGVRLYNPTTGRFLSIDPVPGGSLNAYAYAGQDPVNKYDLDGKCWQA